MRRPILVLGLALAVGVTAVEGAAQDADGFAWENATELSLVSTSGNASSSTLGLKSSLTGNRTPHTIKIEVGGIRGETSLKTRTATGTPTSFIVNEASASQLTAESYFARTRYDRQLDGAFAFAGFGWDRNTFAGVQNRYQAVLGMGRAWVDDETTRFKTDLGATYTIQKDVDPAPNADEGFGGVRLSVDARRRLTPTVLFQSVLLADENLEDTDDFRGDWTNSVAVALTEGLSFKTSLQLIYDHQPALIGIPLLDSAGVPTGTRVLAPGEELDTVLTVALVISL